MIIDLQKLKNAVLCDREKRWDCDERHAVYCGISLIQYQQLKNGNFTKIPVYQRIEIARQVNYDYKSNRNWKAAPTPVYQYLNSQLSTVRDMSLSGIFCDRAGVGKTFTAREFRSRNANVAYVDASVNKSRKDFVFALAREFGFAPIGNWKRTLRGLLDFVSMLEAPLIIVDEAGDLDYTAFIELKSMYNQLEDLCGFFIMGAEGLKAKFRRNIKNMKVGYTEIFDRLGGKYQRISPEDEEGIKLVAAFSKAQAIAVIKANAVDMDLAAAQVMVASNPGLRRIKILLNKRERGIE
jgi:hypothetical protein